MQNMHTKKRQWKIKSYYSKINATFLIVHIASKMYLWKAVRYVILKHIFLRIALCAKLMCYDIFLSCANHVISKPSIIQFYTFTLIFTFNINHFILLLNLCMCCSPNCFYISVLCLFLNLNLCYNLLNVSVQKAYGLCCYVL